MVAEFLAKPNTTNAASRMRLMWSSLSLNFSPCAAALAKSIASQ